MIDIFNMVDMGGIDVVKAQGEQVDGLFLRLLNSIQRCRYSVLCNWLFAEIPIVPTYVELVFDGEQVSINDLITVTPDDIVHIHSLEPVIQELSVSENGTYAPSTGVDGYAPVIVDVTTEPVIQELSVSENGTYTPPSGVDGYAPVIVNVSGGDDWLGLKNYIESSGTQYIDTGYFPNDRTNVEVVASVSRGTNQYPTIFGMRPQTYSSSGTHDLLIHFYSSNERATLFQRDIGVATTDYTKYADKKAKYFIGAGGFAVESESYAVKNFSPLAGTISSSYSLYIFNFNYMGATFGTSAACVMKLYRMRIFEGDLLIHEFIPWQENGVACLKDAVTSEIKYNSGTGDFVYGTDA